MGLYGYVKVGAKMDIWGNKLTIDIEINLLNLFVLPILNCISNLL